MESTVRSDRDSRGYVTISDIISIVLGHKRIFLSVWLIVVALTVLFIATAPKKYRASVEVVPVQRQGETSGLLSGLGGLGSLASLAGLRADVVQLKDEALASLRSKEFLFSFISENDLLPVLFSNKWDVETSSWTVEEPEDIPTLWDGYKALRKSVIDIYNEERTGIVTISIEWRDPQVAADWANDLVRRLNEKVRLRDIAESEKSLDYLKQQLAATQIVELERSIHQLMKVEINKIMIANVRQEYAFRVVDKALPPDDDQYFFPRVIIVMPIGFVLGAGLALFLVLAWHIFCNLRNRQTVT